MTNRTIYKNVIAIVLMALIAILAACSSSDSETDNPGGTTPPDNTAKIIDKDNASDIVVASYKNVEAKIATQEGLAVLNQVLIANIANVGKTLGSTANITQPSICGGDYTLTPNTGVPSTLEFLDLCLVVAEVGEIIVSGSVSLYVTTSSLSVLATDLSISFLNENYLINVDIEHDVNMDNTTINALSYTDSTGVTHDIASLLVNGNNGTGYTMENGSITIGDTTYTTSITTPLEFNCTTNKRYPSAGTIEVSATDNSKASITFNVDCTTYTVVVNDGAPETFTWPNVPTQVTPQTKINTSNVNNIATATIEEVQTTVQGLKSAGAITNILTSSSSIGDLNAFNCGGEVATPLTFTGEFDLTFSNFCLAIPNEDEILLDGTLSVSADAATKIVAVKTTGFSVTLFGSEYLIALDVVYDETATPPLTINTLTYEGEDGVVHDVNLPITPPVTGGLGFELNNGSITYKGETYSVNIIDPLVYTCDNPRIPSGGKIEVSASDASQVTIEFLDCSSYSVTVDGETYMRNWLMAPKTPPVM